ncbi:hypothetical protein [Kitasatospora kifunensis]|uniref:Uncharacterized protein n=1 Tax=Kitasatospora kifunensis TaxID=58351 RepID=A0A7W7R0Y5_KITKI|nr:hypothetical protein [Kitasatospora kifunensis]MBB4923210.1 hypothetical protein [Kitasatospora kifunensis]
MTGGRQVAACGPVTVELTGITPPATFGRVSDALAALWESMQALPLGEYQFEAYRLYLTGERAEEHVVERLRRQGESVVSFGLADGPHLLSIRLADPQGQRG